MSSEKWPPDIPDGLDPLSPNAGGPGDPKDVVGREEELNRLIEAVTIGGGAHVTGERRMGKTWLVKKLQDQLLNTVTAIYVSAEGNPDSFKDRLLDELRQNRRVGHHVSRWEKEIGGEVKLNLGVFGITLTGKATKAASAKAESKGLDVLDLLGSASGGPVVLIIDEITSLCNKLGPKQAAEFLGGLRSRRQSGGPPLVISGSIGLHHALDDFTPVNDLWPVPVGPMKDADAVILAARLLLGIGVEPTPELVGTIVRETSGIPFYIQGVIDQLRYRDDLDVDAVVADCLGRNLWQTEHYVTRLRDYYGRKDEAYVRAILDVIAVAGAPLSIDDIQAKVVANHPTMAITRDRLLDLLIKLEKDNYLMREGDADTMSSPLLARIWRLHRRLP